MKTLRTMTLVLAGLAANGCAPPPESNEKVAETEIGNGIKLEIVASSNGDFMATQTGPAGTMPLKIDKALIEGGDPIALFKALAPNHPVPASLVAANERSLKIAKDRGKDLEQQPGAPPALEVSQPKEAERAYAVSSTQSNWTGTGHCSPGFFTDMGFCPGNNNNSACFFNYSWAYLEHPNAFGGNGAVCADWGQLLFRITFGGVTDFTVDQGSWRTAVILHKRTCGFWSCSDIRNYTRFELIEHGASGHFGATIDY